MRVLLLGGTTEASRLASLLAQRGDLDVTLSLAGRTAAPARSPLPSRVGGFGGVEGLAAYLRVAAIAAVVDATHPFAARISANAAAACDGCGIPLVRLSRPQWTERPEHPWIVADDVGNAVRRLAALTQRVVFLTTGRQGLGAFRAAPQHQYLIRTIDPPDSAALPPHATVVLGRGPFVVAEEIALMVSHRVTLLVSKNSGGHAAAAKLDAARQLRVPVLMIARPAIPDCPVLHDPCAVLAWLDAHRAPP